MREEVERLIKIFISDDEMSCEICINFEKDNLVAENLDCNDIKQFLFEHEVNYGIDEQAIERLVNEKISDEYVLVASGKKLKKGRDGYYAYAFNTNPNKKPVLREDGSVDYLNLNVIQCVEQGDFLAKYFEKVDGEDGITVKGKIIPATKTKNLPMLRGKGVIMSEDGIMYYAEFDGKVEMSMGGITVSKISTIPGDVDLSVGNLNVKGDLEILGNVCAGMIVKASGSITINGLVEAADIEAGKDILIKGGILGGGKARIFGGGNVYALFIENSAIKSGNCVQADSIVNSIVEAYNDVNIFGKTSAIVGGSIKANRTIRTKNIGSPSQVITRLKVGIEKSEIASLRLKEVKLEEAREEIEKVEKAMKLMQQHNENENSEKQADFAHKDEQNIHGQSVNSGEMSLLLTRTKIEKSTEIKHLSDEIRDLRERINLAKTAEIVAEEMVYQGTIITIDGLNLKVDKDYEKMIFLRKNDRLLTKRYVKEDEE